MKYINYIRHMLLGGVTFGGVALGVAVGGAHAGEIDNLEKKVKALENEILAIKAHKIAQENGSVLVEKSYLQKIANEMSLSRGTKSLSNWAKDRNPADNIPESRGFTISVGNATVQPTADAVMHEPTTVITVGGYAKLDAIYDFDNPLGNAFNASQIGGSSSREEFRMHANQSRFRIKARTETPIGQARSLIEGDFYGSGGGTFRLRHAWGELDLGDHMTLGFGRYWRNGYTSDTGAVATVDFNGPAGLISTSRGAQARLTYRTGPMGIALAVENPTGGSDLDQLTDVDATGPTANLTFGGVEYTVPATQRPVVGGVLQACPFNNVIVGGTVEGTGCVINTVLDPVVETLEQANVNAGVFNPAIAATQTSAASQGTNNKYPDLSMRVTYDVPGGHFFNASGVLRFFSADKAHGGVKNTTKLGWIGSVGANVNLADIATLTTNFIYGEGVGNYLYYSGKAGVVQSDGKIELIEAFGVTAGASFEASETTTLNVVWGWTKPTKKDIRKAYGLYDSSEKHADTMTIHGNIMWEPVDAVRLGWEVIWGQTKTVGGTKKDALRGQFGAWFFF